jgi:uncharacterized protein YndB with AHSA1/START domain
MMPVKKDASGRRSVQLDLDVPGTPEQVWQAIATGAGMTAWFVPTDVDEREGGKVAFHFGPDMGDSIGVVTAWEPPRRIVYEERDWSPGAPPVATEITVEARAGGTCHIRMVHSLFTSQDDWDDQLEGFESGWPGFFVMLRLYLGHFAGQRCTHVAMTGTSTASEAEAWQRLTDALGLPDPQPGQRPQPANGAIPALAGVVERVHTGKNRDMLIHLDQPAPGGAMFGVYRWNDRTTTAVALYLFGDEAPAVVARDEPRWRAWLDSRT